MRSLTAEMAIRAWERGQRTDPLGRSLALLSMALPDLDRRELARLTVSQQDALLFQLRNLTFGQSFKGFALCPQCGTRLEFPLDLSNFPIEETLASRLGEELYEHDGYEVRYRLPNGADLEAAGVYLSVEEARDELMRRTILGVVGPADDAEGRLPLELHETPAEVLDGLSEHLSRTDPLADVVLEIDCGLCHHHWSILFDIATILWREVATLSERLLREVAEIALHYGWNESEILAMSANRRKFYLEQVSPSE